MKETLDEFVIPDDLRDCLERYVRFRTKRFFNTIENKFYVGTELAFHYVQKEKGNGFYCKPLDRMVIGEIDWLKFYDPNPVGYERREFVTLYETLEDFLKDFEPIIVQNKKISIWEDCINIVSSAKQKLYLTTKQ